MSEAAPVAKGGLLRKILHTLGTLLFSQGAGFAAGVATAHAFGPVGKGAISFAAILLTFAGTTATGLNDAIAFQVGRERRPMGEVWRAALLAMALVAPIGVAIFLALAWHDPAQPAYRFVAIAFPFALFVQAVSSLYQLRDRIEAINVRNALTIGGGGSLVMLALVTLGHAPLPLVLGVWAASYVVAAIWTGSAVPALVARDDAARNQAPLKTLVREQAVFGAKAALTANVSFLALRIDVFVVGALLAPTALGIYTLALALGELMWGLSKATLWSSTGRIATLPEGEAATLTAKLVRVTLALQLVGAVVLFSAVPPLVGLVYGHRFAGAGPILRILLPGMIFYSADGMLAYFIAVRLARPALLLLLESVTLAVCGTIALLTVRHFGIAGAAVADTVAYLVSFAIKVAIFARSTGITPRRVLVLAVDDLPARLRYRGASSDTLAS